MWLVRVAGAFGCGWFMWLARLAVAGSCGWCVWLWLVVWLARLAVAGCVAGAFGEKRVWKGFEHHHDIKPEIPD